MTRARTRRRVLTAVALIATAQALAVLLYLHLERTREHRADDAFAFERLDAGPALPQVDFTRGDGSALHSSELRGRPLLLHFWATWCAPCRDELPALLQLGRDEPNLRIVALSLDENWPVVDKFFAGTTPREVVRDPTGLLKRTYDVSALPDTYLVDSNGTALLRFGGARPWQSDAARAALAPMLRSHARPAR